MEVKLKVSYNRLWKLLIDRGMQKKPTYVAVGASKSTFAKLGENENVTLPILLGICQVLECDFGDIMEAIFDNKEGKMQV
ncbi:MULTISPECIES: helix-turn-helix domain-containing protein [unclassified Lysinibacillus]|uniref:helix-turn-helix domain-containing protein n=1 Tax=unclassified Lysinibacillus TaxID=2636778 RepID=UPI0037F83BE2